MRKVLVTGATGFIGNYVIEELLKQNVTVVATSSNEKKASQFSWFNAVIYKPLDFSQLDASTNYLEYFDNPDTLIHMSWEGLPNYKNDFHITENLPRHQHFIYNLIQNGLKDITITGTCFEYGMQEGKLREDMNCIPDNPYAIAKDKLRLFTEDLAFNSGGSFKWARLFYMFGAGQNPNSLISQLEKALEEGGESFNMSGGEQIRDFLPVETIAKNLVKIALQDKVNGIINNCSGIPLKLIDFVQDYLNKKKKTIKLNLGYYPYPTYEPMNFWGDNSKLNSILSN